MSGSTRVFGDSSAHSRYVQLRDIIASGLTVGSKLGFYYWRGSRLITFNCWFHVSGLCGLAVQSLLAAAIAWLNLKPS